MYNLRTINFELELEELKLYRFEKRTPSNGETYFSSFSFRFSTDCTSQNVIYLIECKRCNKQYVCQTNQQVSKRMNSHKFNINNHGSEGYATNAEFNFRFTFHCRFQFPSY